MVRPQLAQQFAERDDENDGVRVAALCISNPVFLTLVRREGLIHAAKQSSRSRRFSDLRSLTLPSIATDVHHVRLKVLKSWSCKCSTQAYTHHHGESGRIFTHQNSTWLFGPARTMPVAPFTSAPRRVVLLQREFMCPFLFSVGLVLQYVSRIFSDASPLFELVVPDWNSLSGRPKTVVIYFQPATHYGSHLELFCSVVKV